MPVKARGLLSSSGAFCLFKGCNLKPVRDDLCQILASAFAREDARFGVSVRCPSADASIARGLLLMLAELVTNAMKHTRPGFPLSIDAELLDDSATFDLKVTCPGRRPPFLVSSALRLQQYDSGELAESRRISAREVLH